MTTIKIDEEVYEKLALRAEEKGFKKADDYINSVLNQVVKKIEKDVWRTKEQTMSLVEEEKVKARLRALGYIE